MLRTLAFWRCSVHMPCAVGCERWEFLGTYVIRSILASALLLGTIVAEAQEPRHRPEERAQALLDSLPAPTDTERVGVTHFLHVLLEAAEADLTEGRFALAFARGSAVARDPTIQASHRDLRDRAEAVLTASGVLRGRETIRVDGVFQPLVVYAEMLRDQGDVARARSIARYVLAQIERVDWVQVLRWRREDHRAQCRALLAAPIPDRIGNPTPMDDLRYHQRMIERRARALAQCTALLREAPRER